MHFETLEMKMPPRFSNSVHVYTECDRPTAKVTLVDLERQ